MNRSPAVEERPDWLEETVSGLTTSTMFRTVFVENKHLIGRRYAIIMCPGHTAYIDRVTGSRYAPAEYLLVEKSRNYWHGPWIAVHTGRLTNAAKGRLVRILEDVEERGQKAVDELKKAERARRGL